MNCLEGSQSVNLRSGGASQYSTLEGLKQSKETLYTNAQYVEGQLFPGGPKTQAPVVRIKSKAPLYLARSFVPPGLTRNSSLKSLAIKIHPYLRASFPPFLVKCFVGTAVTDLCLPFPTRSRIENG